jgi:hypothetical protein
MPQNIIVSGRLFSLSLLGGGRGERTKKTSVGMGKIHGIFPPGVSQCRPPVAAACARRWRGSQHAVAARRRSAQQGVARLSTAWTARSRGVLGASQGLPRARASGQLV